MTLIKSVLFLNLDAILALWEKLPWQHCYFTCELLRLTFPAKIKEKFVAHVIIIVIIIAVTVIVNIFIIKFQIIF